MEREFIILPEFDKKWKSAGLSDTDLLELQTYLCKYPKSGPIIPETGGLRKLRWNTNKGKRGGIRAIYVDFMRFEKIYLITAYTKKDKSDLTLNERHQMRNLIKMLENTLERGSNKCE